jgi:hypothetical protein
MSASEPATPAPERPRLLKTEEAASYLGIGMATLERWRAAGAGPRYLKLPAKAGRHTGSVRYRPADLDAFLLAYEVVPMGMVAA